ncbi:hypothetical protein NONI108955_40935 [Nocardia ninae]
MVPPHLEMCCRKHYVWSSGLTMWAADTFAAPNVYVAHTLRRTPLPVFGWSSRTWVATSAMFSGGKVGDAHLSKRPTGEQTF